MIYFLSSLGIIAAFSQTTSTALDTERVSGSMLFLQDSGFYITITEPIKQRLRIGEKSVLIYYPKHTRAFRIIYEQQYPRRLRGDFPSFSPIDLGTLEKAGMKEISRITEGDSTIVQYVKSGKDRFPVITAWLKKQRVWRLTVATGSSAFFEIDITEYGNFDDQSYLKKYKTSFYESSSLTEEVLIEFQSLRYATKADVKRMMFEIPEWIEVEEKTLY